MHITCSNKYQLDKYPVAKDNWFVYMLYFNKHFYIGGTNKLRRRVQAHICSINSIMSGKCRNLAPTYNKVLNHITSNNLTEFRFYVYADCIDLQSAIKVEKYLLDKYFNTSKCLNISNQSKLW